MAEENSLNFFHGALLDEDADAFLVQEGDYLIQAKPERRYGAPKLILAVRNGSSKIRRIDIVKIDRAGYRCMGKSYADLQQIITKFSTQPLELANGDTVLLKRAIPRGKLSFIHENIRLQQKIYSDIHGTVYKGVMVKDGRPIIVKHIDFNQKKDQALIDMMKEARVMQLFDHPNIVKFYGYIVDRTPYLLVMELCSDGAVEDKLRSSLSDDVYDSYDTDVIIPLSAQIVSQNNHEKESDESSPIPSEHSNSSYMRYLEALSNSDIDNVSSASSEKPRNPGFVIIRDFRRLCVSPEDPLAYMEECSSLTSGESSSYSEIDNEGTSVQLSPQYYNDTSDSSDEEGAPDLTTRIELLQKCKSININFNKYWKAVRKLAEDRQTIIKKLKKQLKQSRRFKNDDKVNHINAKVHQIETLLNSYIPIVPRWKSTFQKDSNKNIIIRNGFIYKRIDGTNEFRCVYEKEVDFSRCLSFLVTDDCDYLIEGSFCYHYHPGTVEFTEDLPPLRAIPISLPRVTKNGEKYGKYDKLIDFLDQTLNEIVEWQSDIFLCIENLDIIEAYLSDLEKCENLHISKRYRIPYKMVIAETKNLLRCVRFDKFLNDY